MSATRCLLDSGRLNSSDYISLAKMAERSKRYRDMCLVTKHMVTEKCKSSQAITIEERNLLSVAYKGMVGSIRCALRKTQNENKNTVSERSKEEADAIEPSTETPTYSNIIIDELEAYCIELVELVSTLILPSVQNECECLVYWEKIIADYFRYLAEYVSSEQYEKRAKFYYVSATKLSNKILSKSDPTRLSLALNVSVFYYDILKEERKAAEIAKQAFDGGIDMLTDSTNVNFKDATVILDLLKDNLLLWTEK